MGSEQRGIDDREKERLKEIETYLYKCVKKGNWDGIIKKYGEERASQSIRFTEDGDTILHLAIYEGNEQVVKNLVDLISISQNKKALNIQNKKGGNTPLHVAAGIGNLTICKTIASVDKRLVAETNLFRETPLFSAANSGNKNVFFWLYHSCVINNPISFQYYCNHGDFRRVLRCLMRTQQFDVAYQVINLNNAAGWTDFSNRVLLHTLATNPTAFKSGAHMGLWQQFFYYCIGVDELKAESILYPTATHEAANDNELANHTDVENIIGTTMESHPTDQPQKPSENRSWPILYWTKFFQIVMLPIFIILESVTTSKRVFKKKKKDTDIENIGTTSMESHSPPLDTQLQQPAGQRWMSWGILYTYWTRFIQIIMLPILIILESVGFDDIKKLRKEKQKHTWAVRLMNKLIQLAPPDEYDPTVYNSMTPMLVAAGHGVIEMVTKLYTDFPHSIRCCTENGMNVVLLAAMYRQTEVYNFLVSNKKKIQTLFQAVDKDSNTALHFAADIKSFVTIPWRVTGPALKLQSEIKWYRFVDDSMQNNSSFIKYNRDGKFAKDIFNGSHKDLLDSGREWLVRTSEACSLLAALITTVVFASATTVPGGNGDNGTSPLERETGFFVFAISSLTALCLSTTSVIAFLSILSSKFEMEDFAWKLPVRLLIGLSSLFFSIAAMLVSFCAGHYFMLSHRLQNMGVVTYVAASLPIALFFAMAQIHLYYDLLIAIFSKLPIN